MATIYDIAREAHVGIGTVSRVFNDHPSVSEVTRKRVLAVASRLQYQPHPYARGLARKRTNAILAIVPFFSTFFFVEVLRGVQAKLSEHQCDLVLHGVNHPDQIESSLHKHALRGRPDGVLFFSMNLPDGLMREAKRLNTPVVLVDTAHEKFDSITIDNERGAYLATRHLLTLGHRRVGLLSANLESAPARERLAGYQRALREAGIAIEQDLIKRTTSPVLDGFTQETGYALMREFLAMEGSRPGAVVVSSDIQAMGALEALREADIACPDGVAIIGFDDIVVASHLGLTTMRQPMFQMGFLAAERLLGRMEKRDLAPLHTTFTPELVVRKTCGGATRARNEHAQLSVLSTATK